MYSHIIGSFLKSIRALVFYVNNIEPVIEMNNCSDEAHNEMGFAYLIRAIVKAKEAEINIDDIDIHDMQHNMQEELGSEIPEEFCLEIKDKLKQLSDLVIERKVDGKKVCSIPLWGDLKRQYEIIESREKQSEILYTGSLFLLITYFENVISRIFYKEFSLHPERISLDSKCVPYKILVSTSDIDEIKNRLIEDEVTTMMYKSFDEWIMYLKKNMKLKLHYIDDKHNIIKEIIARRNLFVHNDGKVNSIYLRLTEAENKGIKKGDILTINRKYIDNAINIIELAGVSIIIELWLKEAGKDEDEIGKIIAFIFDEYLMYEKWEEAQYLFEICLNSKNLNEENRLICKINYWQCFKWRNRYEEVKHEVEQIDFSAVSPKFKLAKLALMDKPKEFFELFDVQNEIEQDTLNEWPIFRGIRESKEYKMRYLKNEQ